jgi:hypothetical protein
MRNPEWVSHRGQLSGRQHMETGQPCKKPSHIALKHLPKLHLTHKSLKTFLTSRFKPQRFKSKIDVRYTKTKTTKKQTVGCWIGDLVKTKSKKNTKIKTKINKDFL